MAMDAEKAEEAKKNESALTPDDVAMEPSPSNDRLHMSPSKGSLNSKRRSPSTTKHIKESKGPANFEVFKDNTATNLRMLIKSDF